MRVRRLTARVTQLTQLGAVNCFLVAEDDGLTLVDAAMRGRGRDILRAAVGAPIRRIVLTHAHYDHVGSLDELAAATPGVEVLLSAREARLMGGDRTLEPGEAQVPVRGSYLPVRTLPTRLLEPGERVGSLLVVASPGHTPGHVAFLDTRDGTLLAGDAFVTLGGLAVAGTLRWVFPLPALATWDRPTALASARALRALNPSRLGVGHGRPLTDPGVAMDAAIAEAERHTSRP
ncbi:MAG TPA: MBL fold metallo-hydrolase [Bacillota bacterium]|nr:MBL fold metallo-hydrolase [Bacillota bacterium]